MTTDSPRPAWLRAGIRAADALRSPLVTGILPADNSGCSSDTREASPVAEPKPTRAVPGDWGAWRARRSLDDQTPARPGCWRRRPRYRHASLGPGYAFFIDDDELASIVLVSGDVADVGASSSA